MINNHHLLIYVLTINFILLVFICSLVFITFFYSIVRVFVILSEIFIMNDRIVLIFAGVSW